MATPRIRPLASSSPPTPETPLTEVLDQLAEAVIVYAADGRLLHVNQAAVAIHGAADADDLRARLADFDRWFEYLSPDETPLPRDQWPLALMARGEPVEGYELRLRPVDGSWDRTVRYNGAWLGRGSREPAILLTLTDVTAHRAAERALLQQQIEMRALFDLIPAMIWFKDTENRHVRVNQRVADAAGLTVAELEGRPCAEFYPNDADQYYADDLQVIASRQPKLGIVEQLRGPNGTMRWIQTDKVPYCDPSGKVIGVVVAAHDITEHKRLDDAIRDQNNRLAILATTAPTVLHSFRLAPDGTPSFPYASPGISEIYGLGPDDLARDASVVKRLWHPDDVARIEATIEESRRSLQPWRQEFRVLHPEKGERWIEGHSMPMREIDGSTTWHGALTDITDRKRTDTALQERLALEERFSLLASLSPGVMYAFTLDAQGRQRFPFASGRLEELFGVRPETLLEDAQPVMARIHAEDIGRIQSTILESARTLTVWAEVFRYDHPRKGSIWVEGRSTPTREADGTTLWHGFLLDVTERKLLEDQLRQSQKMEAIGQLAGGVAHDFNNLLTVILGNATLLAQGVLDPEFAEQARDIVAAAEHGSRLTRQLLLFSRKQVMRPQAMDLNETVASMTSLLQRVLGEDVSLHAEFAPGLPSVLADPGMVEQVLLNLAINSRDAMPNGGRLVVSTTSGATGDDRARLRQEAIDGPWVSLTVSDTGVGIPQHVQPRIFEPFFTTKEAGKGTGLGLATVYGIVTQHGGRITVDSIEGFGTTFRIYFPALPQATSRPGGLAESQPMPGGHETVLIVEDEPSVCRLTANVLQRCGYRVFTAPSGAAALDVWRQHQREIDLVLTDMVMPEGISGPELGRRLQAERHDLRMIYTSGYSAEANARGLSLRQGVNFLQKPYQLDALALAVRQCLDAEPVA